MTDFDNVYTIRNTNEHSKKQVQTMSLQPDYVFTSLYLVKLKIAQKQPTDHCSTLFLTYRSILPQKVVQCSLTSPFVRKFFQQSSDKNLYIFNGFYKYG